MDVKVTVKNLDELKDAIEELEKALEAINEWAPDIEVSGFVKDGE